MALGRPQKNNVDFFPYLIQEGKKMAYIEKIHGNDGYATMIKLLREIGATDYHFLNLSDPLNVMLLSSKCNVSEELFLTIVEDLVKLGKFDRWFWDSCKVIWCPDFIKNIQEAYAKRSNDCMDEDTLRGHLVSLGILKVDLLPLKGGNNTQSRVEYSILDNISKTNIDNAQGSEEEIKPKAKASKAVKKTKEIPTIEEFKTYALGHKSNLDINALEMKYKSWVEAGWSNGHGKKIINWKSTLLNTIPYLKISQISAVNTVGNASGSGKMNGLTL